MNDFELLANDSGVLFASDKRAYIERELIGLVEEEKEHFLLWSLGK